MSVVLDYVVQRGRTRAGYGGTVSRSDDLHVAMGAFARGGWQLLDWLEIFLDLGGELALRTVRYEVDEPGGPQRILAVWPVQPTLRSGIVAWW
jgi:hypothetical protein